jgi:hypothetical protein
MADEAAEVVTKEAHVFAGLADYQGWVVTT